jgi:hypothetical protein
LANIQLFIIVSFPSFIFGFTSLSFAMDYIQFDHYVRKTLLTESSHRAEILPDSKGDGIRWWISLKAIGF